jgi:drug/metabolite transporter (DMT)-like permease
LLGVVLALGSSVAWGTSDFLGGLQTRRSSALGVLLVTQPVGLVLALVVALAFGGDALSASEAAYAVGAGAIGVIALGAFYRAMALGSVSVVATIGALGIAVPVGAGIAGGDSPTFLAGLGALLAFGGALVVAREPDPEWRSANAASVGLAALAGVGFGLFFWGLDLSAPPNPAWTVVGARAGGVGTLLVAGAVVRPKLPLDRSRLPALTAIALCDILANSLFALATNRGLLSLVSVAGSMYSAVTVILARVVLGERFDRVRQAGFVIALVGVAALAAGSA